MWSRLNACVVNACWRLHSSVVPCPSLSIVVAAVAGYVQAKAAWATVLWGTMRGGVCSSCFCKLVCVSLCVHTYPRASGKNQEPIEGLPNNGIFEVFFFFLLLLPSFVAGRSEYLLSLPSFLSLPGDDKN